jgi:hypothetical protein
MQSGSRYTVDPNQGLCEALFFAVPNERSQFRAAGAMQ